MKISALLYVENDLTDSDLTFSEKFLPEQIKNLLTSKNLFTSVKFAIPKQYNGKISNNESIRREDNDDVAFWKKTFADTEADHIVKIFCDSAFLDADIIAEMINVHVKYLAEFTYSENLPAGYGCEIISKELIDAIPETGEKTLPLGQVIRSNINRFDVELFYKEPDIRNLRLSFRSGNPRERRIMRNIVTTCGHAPNYSEVKKIIDNNPDVLYLSPSYVEIELTGKCELDCIFCYRNTLKAEHGDMETGLLRKILNDMRSFDLPYSVCFGGSGEPLMHKNFYEIMDITRAENRIENIIIETNGILADSNFKNYIINNNDKRIKLIFNINGMDTDTYKSIHNRDRFNAVFKNITSIKDSVPENGMYIQVMKINETESFLDKYYDFWEKYKIPIILQKQNTFLGRIKDRSYSDLTPLERTPCWHLQRDLNISSDGTAMFCKQDVNGDCSRGNIIDKSIEQIFAETRTSFLNDYKKKFATNPDCASCNEWYTFNL